MSELRAQVVVIGGGPSGYSAAFRCADLGLSTILVERDESLGGVCLNVGCIPSKTYLHFSKTVNDIKSLSHLGLGLTLPSDLHKKLVLHKDKTVNKLRSGINGLSNYRNIKVVRGTAEFKSSQTIQVSSELQHSSIEFENAIIATGSKPIELPNIPYDDSRVWNSSDALELSEIPEKLLVIGGGIIGLEMASVYSTLGSKVDIVEMSEELLPLVDNDITKAYKRCIRKKFDLILGASVTSIVAKPDALYASIDRKKVQNELRKYDAVLVAIGRRPNSHLLSLDNARVEVNDTGTIAVNSQFMTSQRNIFAVGDVVGQPMLAHKGICEGRYVAELIAGKSKASYLTERVPSIAYTDPELAWVGETEKSAKRKHIDFEAVTVPWLALGRAVASDSSNGLTKLIFDRKSDKLIGGAVVGANGGELLGEICLAIQVGCKARDIAETIHAHPTLHESIALAAEKYEGTVTDLPNDKRIGK